MKKHGVKDKFLEILERQPIIQAACEQVGISRNTYYRWMNEDLDFRSLVNDRMSAGIDLVNDYAESNVLNGIKKGDPGYTKYWLSSRHKAYRRPFPKVVEDQKNSDEIKKKQAEKEIDKWVEQWESIGIPRGDKKYTPEEQKKMKELRNFLDRKNKATT